MGLEQMKLGTQRRQKRWHAYMSSALTGLNAKVRDEVTALNECIENWLDEKTNTFVYLPQKYSHPSRSQRMSPAEVYVLDRWRVSEADFLIANLDHPSFGVGQEMEMACAIGIPVLAFHYEAQQVSRMPLGLPVLSDGNHETKRNVELPAIAYKDQQNYSDLQTDLVHAVQAVQNALLEADEVPKNTRPYSEILRGLLDERNLSISDLAKSTGLTYEFVEAMVQDTLNVRDVLEYHDIIKKCPMRDIPRNRYLNTGLWVLERVASRLKVDVPTLLGHGMHAGVDDYEPLVLASKKGVSLEDFTCVAEELNYEINHRAAAYISPGSETHTAKEQADIIVRAVNALKAGS